MPDISRITFQKQRGARDANTRAADRARKVLLQYEAPPLDSAVDEALLDFIARKKAGLPDAVR